MARRLTACCSFRGGVELLDREDLLDVLEYALSCSEADQTEVLVLAQDSALTRYANNVIHQNVAESNAQLSVRAVVGKKIGGASCNRLERDTVQQTAQKAVAIARLQQENPDFVSLPEPSDPSLAVESFGAETAGCPPERRAEEIGKVVAAARGQDLNASGAFSTQASALAVGNSLGIRAYHRGTTAALTAVVSGEDSSGYAEATTANVDELSAEDLAHTAVQKCVASAHPLQVEAGEYEVVLEELAVGDMMAMLAFMGLGALAYQEERSFMCGRLGEKIADDQVFLWDDGLDNRGIPLPFDFEGVPKQRVSMIEGGIARAVVYDSYTAAREGKASTGHAIPQPSTFGPFPMNLFMKPGDSTVDDMVASIKHGLLVTRFHYTNVVHPKETVMTGMTRDGTFLIEDGKAVAGVKNLRFTQNILAALNHVLKVGKDLKVCGHYGIHLAVPALHLASFAFTSGTEF